MVRLTAIFIAVCVVLIAASLGAVVYLVFGLSAAESAIVALGATTALALYNTVSARVRDRSDVGEQIADLSRGTGDLARQVAEQGRRIAALESEEAVTQRARGAADPLVAEIGELGALVKQLAETVTMHESALAVSRGGVSAPPALATPTPPASPMTPPMIEPGNLHVLGETKPEPKPESVATGAFKGKSADEIVAIVRSAIDANRIDLYLQPILTLPQRKVRYYEAMTRLRTEDGTLLFPADFIQFAENARLMPKIDNLLLFRCVQVLRRLLMKNREIGLFCNISASTMSDAAMFGQFSEFMEANRALAPSLMLEFTQAGLREMGAIEHENMAALFELGFRFSMDHVTDLRMGPRDLAERGLRFVKIPAPLLLNRTGGSADIHAADLSDLLGRHGISLVAERIETEAVVVDLLDYDVRFGQGFLFSPPRPVRAEALQGVADRNDVVARDTSDDGLSPSRAAI